MAKDKDSLRYLPIAQVKPSEVALRAVNKDSEKYKELVDSVVQVGIINPVSVREIRDPESGKTVYGLIDGLHRYSGAIDAGLDSIPAHIMQADEARVFELQIIGNLHVIETKAAEYSKQLIKLLALNPTMTTAELAHKLGKSVTWLVERFNLVKLTDDIQTLVNDGTINITNATNLAKLPQEEQANFVDRAITMTPSEFVPTVSRRTKEIRDAKRQGKADGGPKPFEPIALMQKMSTLKQELKDQQVGQSLINQFGCDTPLAAWKMAVAWTLHLDPISIDIARNKDDEKKKLREEEKAAKKKERDNKKDKEAAKIAAGVSDDDELDEDDE